MNIGIIIKNMRQYAGLTQEELGKKIGVSKPSICHYELGITSPTPDLFFTIAITCGFCPFFQLEKTGDSYTATQLSREIGFIRKEKRKPQYVK